MNALLLQAYNNLTFTQVEVPPVAPHDVLVAVHACGICGSDVHGMDGSTGRRQPPIIMGHEAAGVIAEVGSAVAGWRPGDRVTFDSTISCGICRYCRAGRVNLCGARRVLGVSCGDYRQHGAFAEFVALPQHILYRVPQDLPLQHAAMVEPVSVTVHAVERAPLRMGATAVVIGAGMIGLLILQALRARGCGTIIVIDMDTSRLKMARAFGADITLLNTNNKTDGATVKPAAWPERAHSDPHPIHTAKVKNGLHGDTSEDPLDTHNKTDGATVKPAPGLGRASSADTTAAVLEATQGEGADVVFEAVGAPATVATAIACTRKGGDLVLVGNLAPQVPLPLQAVVTRELTLYGSCASAGEYPACLELMQRGRIQVAPLISALAPLHEGAAWFQRLYQREPGLLKVILQPG